VTLEWETLRGGSRPLMHVCLLSPCNCDGRLRAENVALMTPGAARVLEQKRHASNEPLSQAQRSSPSPVPDAYPAWIA